MRYIGKQITFQEVPNEISLSFLISGCGRKCKGCHSPDARNGKNGLPLTDDLLRKEIIENTGITSVLFLGGEWEEKRLLELISIVKEYGLKVALYSGREEIPESIFNQLDYLKTGSWMEKRGGLNSPTTNQKIINTKTGENLNHYFLK